MRNFVLLGSIFVFGQALFGQVSPTMTPAKGFKCRDVDGNVIIVEGIHECWKCTRNRHGVNYCALCCAWFAQNELEEIGCVVNYCKRTDVSEPDILLLD